MQFPKFQPADPPVTLNMDRQVNSREWRQQFDFIAKVMALHNTSGILSHKYCTGVVFHTSVLTAAHC